MKVACPKCQKRIKAPDDWAGKRVRCPNCKNPVKLPARSEAPAENAENNDSDVGFSLDSLSAIEGKGQAIVRERKGKPLSLKEAQAANAAEQPDDAEQPQDPTLRVCPKCKQQVRVADLYSDIICSHCGAGIPGRELTANEKARYQQEKEQGHGLSFYQGFTGAGSYPIPALGHISLGMGIALGAIALPLLGILAFTASSNLNPVTKQETDFGWVGIFITVAFIAEAIYFGSVAYYAMIDSIRATTSGAEQPPTLTWNIISLGAALGGYVALVLLYVLATFLLVLASAGMPTSLDDLSVLAEPFNLIVLALITFGIPMNLIGLSSGNALDGLNPVKVLPSLGKTIGHYIFLYLIMLLFLGIYVGIMYVVMSWAGPIIMRSASEGMKAGFLNMLAGIVAWAALIGAGFYFAYSMGRILGLFARTYRENLDFEI